MLDNKRASTVFTATFADGSTKSLRNVSRPVALKPCEIGMDNTAILLKDECPLYYRDWSSVPMFGSFKKHYPPYAKTV